MAKGTALISQSIELFSKLPSFMALVRLIAELTIMPTIKLRLWFTPLSAEST